LLGVPVIVHVFQARLIKERSFTVKGVFGPEPLQAAQILKLSTGRDTDHKQLAI